MAAPHSPAPIKGALAGLAAGLVASYAMNRFQAFATKLSAAPPSNGDPSTVKAAQAIATIVTGDPLPADEKEQAGDAVHYVTGAALGALYGIAAEYRPEVTRGFGTAFGSTTAMVLDEGIVPALGLAASPAKTPVSSHVFGAASHWVFGVTTELVRRTLRGGRAR